MASPEEAAEQAVEVTEQDAASLAEKLTALGEALSAGERALLHELMERTSAEQEGDDVAGYAMPVAKAGSGWTMFYKNGRWWYQKQATYPMRRRY